MQAHDHRPGRRRVVGGRHVQRVRLQRAVHLGAVRLRERAGAALPRVLARREAVGVRLRGLELALHEVPVARRLAEVRPAHLGVLDEHLGRGQADLAHERVGRGGLLPGRGERRPRRLEQARVLRRDKTTLLRVASSWPSSPEKRAASRYWPSATSGTVHSSVPETAGGAVSSTASPRSASFAPSVSCSVSTTRARTGASSVAPAGRRNESVTRSPGWNARRRREQRLRLVRRRDRLVVAERVDRARLDLHLQGEGPRVERGGLVGGRGRQAAGRRTPPGRGRGSLSSVHLRRDHIAPLVSGAGPAPQ